MSRNKLTITATVVGLVIAADQAGLQPQAQAVEIITRRSGFDEVNNVSLANGAADVNITQTSNPNAGLPLTGAAFTQATFTAAQSGGTAFVTAPHGVWLPPASFTDPQARWINWVGNLTPRSVLYAVPFTVTTTNITNATLAFDWAVDDSLGDPGNPNPAGVYIGLGNIAGAAAAPIISAGFNNAASSATRNITGQIQTGLNYLYVYQRDIGAAASGTIFSATLTIIPEPATTCVVLFGAGALLMRRPRRA